MSTAKGVSAVVPVKDLRGTKSRLAPILDPGARAGLTLYMMGRVVRAIAQAGVEDVRGQPRPNGSAGGKETRRNTARPGEPRAQSRPRRGTPQGAGAGAPRSSVLPADLPLLDAG